MGDFRIIIHAVGGHGQDREKGNGEIVDFEQGYMGEKNPEAIIKRAVEELKATGNQVIEATVHHWPNSEHQVLDNLLTGRRIGDF